VIMKVRGLSQFWAWRWLEDLRPRDMRLPEEAEAECGPVPEPPSARSPPTPTTWKPSEPKKVGLWALIDDDDVADDMDNAAP